MILSMVLFSTGIVLGIQHVLKPSWDALRYGTYANHELGRFEYSLMLVVGSVMMVAVAGFASLVSMESKGEGRYRFTCPGMLVVEPRYFNTLEHFKHSTSSFEVRLTS